MKFIHLTSSRFESTSKIFKSLFRMNSPSISDFKVDSSPRTLSSKPSPTLKTKNTFSYPSPNHQSHHFKDDSSSSNFTKEILGFRKTPDLTSSKIIFKKTSGCFKTFSSSYLGPTFCSKSKSKAEKHPKSSFNTRLKPSDSSCSSRSTSSRNRGLIILR